MAEQENQIVDRMKTEGQLVRNTGTNSIKAIRVDLDRFNDVFESINKNLVMQSSFLESIYNLKVDERDRSFEAREDQRRLEDLAINEPVRDSADTSAEEDNEKDDKKKESEGSILGRLFSSSFLGKMAIAAVATPFVWRFMRGFVDQLTGGKWSEFETLVTDRLPDLWENARSALRTVYTNINNFLDTGNIEDLFKDSEGNAIFDLNALTEKATTWASVAASYSLFGPLGAIKTAVSAYLINTVEDLTGFDIPESAEFALTTLLGVPGSGRLAARGALTAARITASIGRSLIATAIRAVALNPVAALAIGAGILVGWGVTRLNETINEYQATQTEADRMLADARERARLATEVATPLEEAGAEIAEDTNSGLTSSTNMDQIARAVAAQLPMVDILDEAGEVIGQRKLTLDELSPEDQSTVYQRAMENLRPWIAEEFTRLNSNQGFYSNLVGQLIDNDVGPEALEQLRYFLDIARRQAELGDVGAATAYNTILGNIENLLGGANLSEIEQYSSPGFAEFLRGLGFTDGMDADQMMLDFDEIQRRIEERELSRANEIGDGAEVERASANLLINNGGNSIRQGDTIAPTTIQIISPTPSHNSLSNNPGVMTAFA